MFEREALVAKTGRGLGDFGKSRFEEEIRNPRPQRANDELFRRTGPYQSNDPVEVREKGPAQAKADQGYRRHAVTPPDPDGYVWILPSATSNPPRPRTKVIGYNLQERRVRTIFREGSPASPNATWAYENVSPQEWERLRRVASTGKYINRVLNSHPYGRDEFEGPR